MNGKKSARIHFVTALIVAIVATAVAFTLFFISGENGIYSKISAENSSQNEQPPQADVPALSEFKTVEEMQQAIDKYTQYLASDLLELVNNENAVREKDLDLISVSGFSDIKLEREAAEKIPFNIPCQIQNHLVKSNNFSRYLSTILIRSDLIRSSTRSFCFTKFLFSEPFLFVFMSKYCYNLLSP